MRITNLAIKYRTSIVVLTLLVVVGGLYSYLTIPKESTPSIEIPTIVITTIYPGASPDDIESVVTQPIEQEVGSISGIDDMRSTSTEGVSTIVVEFLPNVDLTKAYQEINQSVDAAQPDLPEAVEDPSINEIDTSEFPIVTVNLAANYSLARLKEVAKDLQDAIEGVPGILEANLVGGLEREVRVNVDLGALRSRGLTLQTLVNTIDRENTSIPGGSIDVGDENFLVRVNGQFDHPARQIANLVVAAPGGKPVYVRDVADVVFGFKDRETYARLQTLQRENADGDLVAPATTQTQQVISLSVKKRPGDNILDAVENVKQTIADFDLPSGTNVTITGDQSENVRSLVTDLENNIISGLIFVVVVLLFFMGVRNATLVGIAIPLSMFTTFIYFQAAGYTLNFIMLFSLIIALGMLVDNAIVIVENIYRFHENGHSRLEAARLGTAEVGGAVIASTATTVFAFAPMLFWPGVIGKFMGYMPLTLIVTLTCSLFVALIINPVVTGLFVKIEGEEGEPGEKERPGWVRWAAVGAVAFTALLLAFVNWKTLLVLVVLGPAVYFLYTRALKPVGDRFVAEGMPRLIERYRGFQRQMLSRDYDGAQSVSGVRSFLKNPFARNMGALVALAAGLILCAVGGFISSLTVVGGLLLLVPGGLLLLVGFGGVFFHLLEVVFLGGWTSVNVGVGLAALFAVVLALQLPGGGIALPTLLMIVAFPLLLAAVGFYGALHDTSRGVASAVDNVLLILAGFLVVAAVLGGLGSGLSMLSGTAGTLPAPVAVGLPLVLAVLVGIVAALGRLYQRRRRQAGAPGASARNGFEGSGSSSGNGSGNGGSGGSGNGGSGHGSARVEHLVLTDHRAALLNGAVGLLFLIVLMFALQPTGVAFFPDSDPGRVQITLDAPTGTNVKASNRIAEAAHDSLEALLSTDPAARANLKNIVVNVGVGGDAAFGGGANRASRSRLSLDFVDFAQRSEGSPATLRSLRRRLRGFPGVDMDFTKEQQGPPTGAPVNIEVSGPDFDQILAVSRTVKSRLRAAAKGGTLPGLVDVADDADAGRPEVRVDIDRERANAYGLSTVQIAQEVRAAVNGTKASTYRDGEDEYDITVRAREADRQKIESLEGLVLNTPQGAQIPLSSIATLDEGSGLGSITRLDQKRVVTVTGDAAPGYNGQAVLGRVQKLLESYRRDLPPGYTMKYTGANEEQQDSFGFLGIALGIGVALIFMVLIAQFNSVSAPFIIMVAVALSMIGVMLGLILTRTPFSLFTFIGVISLAGIVVNNNIVLVDYIMQLRAQGMEKQEAIIEAGATRMRPVLLTALTTILGLVPLTFGINVDFVGLLTNLEPNFQIGSENTQFWGPMGTALIAGLFFGTFLTLVIVPVMYSAFDSLSLRAAGLFGGTPQKAGLVTDTAATEGGMAAAPGSSSEGSGEGSERPQEAFAPGGDGHGGDGHGGDGHGGDGHRGDGHRGDGHHGGDEAAREGEQSLR